MYSVACMTKENSMEYLIGCVIGWLLTCAAAWLWFLFLVGDERPGDDDMECAECGESIHPMLFPSHDCDNPGQQLTEWSDKHWDADLGSQDMLCNCSSCTTVINDMRHGVKCEFCSEWYDSRAHQICPECG